LFYYKYTTLKKFHFFDFKFFFQVKKRFYIRKKKRVKIKM